MNKTQRREKKAVGRIKMFIILVSVMMLGIAALGTTLAYLSDSTNPIANIFNPSNMNIEIQEEFNNDVKTNVTVKNTGDTTAYIRAAIVVTWQDGSGNVYGQKPAEGDYDLKLTSYDENDTEKWIKGADGFYYWTKPVAAGASTGELIDTCTSMGTAPEGYALCVEILGSGIQSVPEEVVENVWGVTVDNGVITAGGGNQ